MSKLIQFIDSKVPLEEKSKALLSSISSEKTYKKGDTLLKIGGYCRHLYFINEGLAKLGFHAGDGEFILRFFQEDILFTELESLTSNKPSKYQIIALEDITCTRLTYSDFEKISKEDARVGVFYRKLLTIAHINMMNRISEMLESDAKTRYNNFLDQNAAIINRITLGDLSRYLGINQVTLSRIRSNLSSG
ncbi:Crp/Fnr family transcriptional regulator [Saprospiraceae bacterium]|nr:Crp/Fnr family transcriptional regulator [Saprospiraceae bacterium]